MPLEPARKKKLREMRSFIVSQRENLREGRAEWKTQTDFSH